MKKYLKSKLVVTSSLVLMLGLVACSGDDDANTEPSEGNGGGEGTEETPDDDTVMYREDGIYSIDMFSPTIEAEGEAVGGTLNYALSSDAPIAGTLNPVWSSGVPDREATDWFYGAFFTLDETFTYTDEGLTTVEQSDDGKVINIKLNSEVNWHDGEPLTMDDYLYAHEVIAHPDYAGVRFGQTMRSIEGIMDYHNGEADTISGINVISDDEIELTFTEASPALMASGLWGVPLARHLFEQYEVADMEEVAEVRENPIGFGPYIVDTVTPGESVTYTKNEDYWQGEPKLDGVVFQVINPSVVAQAIRSGEVDMIAFPENQFEDNADMTNVNWIGRIGGSYSYVGFKLGDWDGENNTVNTDPDMKMSDVNLRKAMALAVDWDEVGQSIYNGLRWGGTTVIPPYHSFYHDETNEGHGFDPDEANRILDEAGYEMNGDYRQTPDGEDLVINFASMSGDATSEVLADHQIQSWGEIGLNVQLVDGSLMEFNSFYDRVGQNGEDDPGIDVYAGAWSVGSDVDPSGVWGPNELFNFSRYSSDELDDLFARGNSVEALDLEYRQDVYNEFQEYFNEVIPAFPTMYRPEIIAFNDRVSGYSFEPGNNDLGYHTIQLNSETPSVDE